jgi:hypothetical protein
MLGRPVQCPRLAVGSGTGYDFRQLIAVRFPYPEIRLTICRQLMGLVKDNQIVRLCCRLLEATKQSVPSQGVDADDEQVAVGAKEGIAGSHVGAADNAKRQAEQGAHFPLPVADQTGGRHD